VSVVNAARDFLRVTRQAGGYSTREHDDALGELRLAVVAEIGADAIGAQNNPDLRYTIDWGTPSPSDPGIDPTPDTVLAAAQDFFYTIKKPPGYSISEYGFAIERLRLAVVAEFGAAAPEIQQEPRDSEYSVFKRLL
jgi:hypothetical protein